MKTYEPQRKKEKKRNKERNKKKKRRSEVIGRMQLRFKKK